MATLGKQWYVEEDGSVTVGEPAKSVTYHSSLNSIIVTTDEPAVKIYDVTSGSVLQKSNLSVSKGDGIQCAYLQDKDKMVFSNSTAVGVRRDLHGVLMLDSALQTPVNRGEDTVRVEIPLAEASQLLKSLEIPEIEKSLGIPEIEDKDKVIKELEKQIKVAQEATKGNHKTLKWATVCVELPHTTLKSVCSSLVTEMRRINLHSPGLSIASSLNDRLSYLLPSSQQEPGSPIDRNLMYSEAARRETFKKWPHMNYKWALPDPMAQAGFYHQPNQSGDDRAMCFTCNVCLVCWEPTDEPWSEHERHSPSCPFVRGEHTQNVPLSVTYATQPALCHGESGEKIDCVSTTASEDYVATSTKHGSVVIWNLKRKMKKHCEFTIDPADTVIAVKTGLQRDRTTERQTSQMMDSLEEMETKGAEGTQEAAEDIPDAMAVTTEHVAFTLDDGTSKDEEIHVIPLHKKPESVPSWSRPSEDVIVSSMCIVEKEETESSTPSSHKQKDSAGSKAVKTPVQPSLICGVSLRRTKFPLNCEDKGGGNDLRTEEVQIMNKVNEVVSGESSPQIITNTEECLREGSCSTTDYIESTLFTPYILVVAGQEDIKKLSKTVSTDSLKPSASTSNVPSLGTLNQDWSLLDHMYMYDSDPDCQIVKVEPPPGTLSAISPTEGTSTAKQETKQENSEEGNQPGNSSSESAIKVPSNCPKSGAVLQCVELPDVLQSENLQVKCIAPTLDRQHIVVVVGAENSEKLSKSVIEKSETDQGSVSSDTDTGSFNPLAHSTSNNSDKSSTEQSDVENQVESMDITKSETESSETSTSMGSEVGNCNCNKSSDNLQENESNVKERDSSTPCRECILIYRINYSKDHDYALIEETPIVTKYLEEPDCVIDSVVILSKELNEHVEEEEIINCDDEISVPTPSQASLVNGRVRGVYGQMAVIYGSGMIAVFSCSDLSVLAEIKPQHGDRFTGVTYCSGIDRLCLCSSQGQLYFYQISEDYPNQTDSLIEGSLTPTTEAMDSQAPDGSSKSEEVQDASPKTSGSELLAKQPITFESLSSLHNLIQFDNLMPRFSATVPPCWSEIQQEQQQRRHPQHLQHQGEATQHTRTWKLQPDNNSWDEHLFEIVLPRVCCVGHVDVKFTLNPMCTTSPKIQVTLLKQNISAIGRPTINVPDPSTVPVDSKINFNIKSTNSDESDSSTSSGYQTPLDFNNVLDPSFLENHNAEILCGPVYLSDCMDLSEKSGLVSLTSSELLISKPRSFLLHIKGFPAKKEGQASEKGKEPNKKKRTAAQSIDKYRTKSIKALFENYGAVTNSKTKLDNLKGCDWLHEVSITIRKTKKTNVPKERLQRKVMIEVSSFQEKLLSTVSFDENFLIPNVSPDYVQNIVLDILIWITYIQMNDKRENSKSILPVLQQKLGAVIQACYIQGTRSTAHKCTRLLALCMEFNKHSSDQAQTLIFCQCLLEALINCLPLLPCTYSSGGLKWFFILLNRVKNMDVMTVSHKCSDLLAAISKHFSERASPYHDLLKSRYCLNGHPFEPDLFDMELPESAKQIIPGVQSMPTYASIVSGTTSVSSGTSLAAQQQEELDFYDLFNYNQEKSVRTQTEHVRNHVIGMLEVEPLHFTCHSASDGTKMERLDTIGASSGSSGAVITSALGPGTTGLGTSVLGSGALGVGGLGTSGLTGTINFGETLPVPPPLGSLNFPLPSSLGTSNLKFLENNSMNKDKIIQKLKKLVQIKYEKNPPGSDELMPSTPKTTPQVMTPPLTPPNEAWQQLLADKLETPKSQPPAQPQQIQRPSVPVTQPHALLQAPAPQVLVIERIYSGARRFVILDFGKPILLTDVIIPYCGDLASLSIDVWVQGEEVDAQRLVVAGDIGQRSLVMNNIMPAPVCRFLKMTTIGKYGSGTTRSKIPIGSYYGHSYILPWEWSPKLEHQTSPTTSSVACQLDLPSQSQLLTHLGSFMSLLEDIQCRYSLARTRLEILLKQVQSLQYASHHTQYFLKKNKKNDEDNSIIQAYNDCLQLQLQQNLAQRAIDRLQSAIGLRLPVIHSTANSTALLRQASTDKLRYILESLLETVISTSISSSHPGTPQPLMSLCPSLDSQACQDLFKHLCIHGTPRIQVLTGMLLVRVCGSQPWFGDFVGKILQEYFHSEAAEVFPQDRVFILLTAMGQRSLQGPSSVSIMESLLSVLARVLSPIMGNHGGGVMPHTGQVDLTLIGWILLFLSRNLDNTLATNGNGDEEGAAKKEKEQGNGLSNRWNFIQASSNVKSEKKKTKSVGIYRRSLQKRLLHHKQKLKDLENAKKAFMSQDKEGQVNHSLYKQQEKQFHKELSKYASKHVKDIIQIRKTDAEVLRKLPKDSPGADGKEVLDFEADSVLVLPKDRCLPVVQGLMALLLGMDFTCNVDLFLITCKVLARVCIATRPAITLTEAMSQEQLERLIMLTANLEFNHGNITWGGPWAGHALTCLLQDILEGERVYPCTTRFDGITDDDMSTQTTETDYSLPHSVSLPTLEESDASLETTETSDAASNQSKDDTSKLSLDKESSLMVDMLLSEPSYNVYDDETADKLHAYMTGENIMPPQNSSASYINVMYVQPMANTSVNGTMDISGTSNVGNTALDDDEVASKKAFSGKKVASGPVFGSTSYKANFPPTGQFTVATPTPAVGPGLSTALDARLECGLETKAEIRLRKMLSIQTDTLQGAFTAPLPMPPANGHSTLRAPAPHADDDLAESVSNPAQVTSSEMLSCAFNDLFSQLLLQRVNLDSLLHLWLTLNEEPASDDSNTTQATFDPSRCPSVPLSVTSVSDLLACVSLTPNIPIQTWVLVFQSLTLLANLKISSETDAGIERSMVVAMLADSNLVPMITKFLSGSSFSGQVFTPLFQVGPSAVKAFHLFLQRLQIAIFAEDHAQNLKEIMLKLVYSLTAERGSFHIHMGPLDAQCKFLEFILELSYDQVDINNAISVIESVSTLVHHHILCQERVTCRSTSDNTINARSCFGGLFANLLRGGDSKSNLGDYSRDLLMCSLLKLVNALVQVQFPQRHNRRISVSDSLSEPRTPSNVSMTDSNKLSQVQALATSTPHPSSRSRSDEEKCGQTDEEKTESSEPQGIVLADIILSHRTIMSNFIQALSYCTSSTMAMILGSSDMPSNIQDSFTGGDPLSVGDGIYQILVTLTKKCNDNRLVLESLFLYLTGGFSVHGSPGLCRLSEPLLWFIHKVLDTSRMLKLFLEKGGVEVICRNFVNCNSRIISTTPSLISTMMQNMNGRSTANDKKKKWETENSEGLQNFAPLGTIVSSSPTASPAEVLILTTPQHRRARSAPWSYHFYPDEAWVDLKITLPFAILLKEVQIQPHSPALSTCPAFVSLEASQDGVTSFPLCAPLSTSSLVFIKLQLQKPEVVTTVMIRLHKARDSMTIGLSQILLMGYSAFGEAVSKTSNLFMPTEDYVSKSSLGWIRLLYHCLRSYPEIEPLVAEAAAPTPGLLNTCTALLVSPISNVYLPTIEAVLQKLGLHSGEMGLQLIDNLLRSNTGSPDSGYAAQYLGKVSGVANDSTVEILYQLGTKQDRWTADRVRTMLIWLGDSARVELQRKAVFSDDGFRPSPHELSGIALPGPAPSHVHCIASILWQSHELPVEYNLSQLITRDLVSSLYEWSTVLPTDSHLKKSVDYVLCAICHIYPEFFTRIMEWMGIVIMPDFGLSAPMTDDRKDSSHYTTSMTDDSKEASNALGQSVDNAEPIPSIVLQDFKRMCLDESHLSTLAYVCKSPIAVKQLLESGFPAVLAQGLFEFCNRVISMFADSWSQPEGITDSCKSMSGSSVPRESDSSTQNHTGLCVTADMVAAVLRFFSEVSSEVIMKDWLGGADGNIFWPVLLTMLCNTPLHTPVSINVFPQKHELISAEERTMIETASVSFFSRVIACHVPNQMLFAKVLCDVIKEQGIASKAGLGICPLSGFTRRLFLQVLLEDERILIAIPQQYHVQLPVSINQIQHPCFGAGRKFRTMSVNMHISVGELINKISDTPSLAAQLLEVQSDKKSDESKKDSGQLGLEMVEYISAATSVDASSGVEKDLVNQSPASKSSIPPRPPTRRGRTTETLSSRLNLPVVTFSHKLINNKSLPTDLSLSQLIQVLQQQGLPQGQSVLEFVVKVSSKSKDTITDENEEPDEIPSETLLSTSPFPTPLLVFASVGGLALLAEHLPLLFPEISRQITLADSASETTAGPADASQEWVTLDAFNEDFYDLYEPMSPAPQSRQGHAVGMPSVPPHSLVAFGLFLRLNGYADVLLKERKKAQCLLRLVLGVTDDGDGGHILTSSLASSLPTLPFIVLKSLFDASPLTTDDGVLLRRMCLDIGALQLILACLSVLSHHAPRVTVPGFQQETQTILTAMQTPSTSTSAQVSYGSEEKSQQYWAKGTGFGTGSTTSSWDAEQALLRQKSEEEHVTCLLQVLASYINPGGNVPENFGSEESEPTTEKSLLPSVIPELLSQSCLVPAVSSYLRNDSVLDMARHVPLYRALLELLRGLAVCPNLVMLLMPLEESTWGGASGTTSVGELLEKMRGCVDTYASRLKSNNKGQGKTVSTKEEEEENEGLAKLIPDIQETARIVHSATESMWDLHKHSVKVASEAAPGSPGASKERSRDSLDQIYLTEMKKLQFDQFEMVEDEGSGLKFKLRHHYENNVKAAGDVKNPNRIRRLAQEAVTLSTSLPLSVSSSVFVRCDEERLDIMKVLITGPEDTPYANGCYEFDVYFPQDYPNAPPCINLETTGNHSVRFNPNLYNDGKVCLSVLNTWHGRPEEKWNAQTSSFLQVLVSIQSLILVCEPYFNEPGYERSRGTPSGTACSREYDANIRQANIKWAVLEQIKNPSPCFKEVVQKHFWMKRHKILKQCEEWIAEMESYSNDKRTGRTIAHSTLALKRHYNQLREEFSKTKAPPGLEEIDGDEIDPKEKQYQTDQGAAAGSKESTPGPQIVQPDNNANSMINPEDLPHIGAVDT